MASDRLKGPRCTLDSLKGVMVLGSRFQLAGSLRERASKPKMAITEAFPIAYVKAWAATN